MKKGLGKGLSALINEDNIQNIDFEKNNVVDIDINKIEVNKEQPRKTFLEESIIELANSIKNVGVISPIIVKRKGKFYQIVSGERRFRACKLLKFKKIPALVREYDELKNLEVALIENIQRENLNPIEEALTYKKFQDEFSLNQDEISEKVGKSRAAVSNSIRLLKLDERVQEFIKNGVLFQGHSKVLLAISDKNKQFEIAQKIIEENLSVRQTEKIVKNILENSEDIKNESYDLKSKIFSNISDELKNILGTKVKIKENKNNKGKIEIEYYSEEDLERLIYLFKKI